MIGEFIFIGIIAAFFGMFYRMCLVNEDFILHSWYLELSYWVYRAAGSETSIVDKIKGWLAYPLGYCIYCYTPWISIILYILYLCSFYDLPSWHWIIIGGVAVLGTAHVTLATLIKYLLKDHPDLE